MTNLARKVMWMGRAAVSLVGLAILHPQTGFSCVGFSEPVELERVESTVVGLADTQFEGQDFPRVVNGTGIPNPCDSNALIIQVTDAAGTPTDTRFSFVVP